MRKVRGILGSVMFLKIVACIRKFFAHLYLPLFSSWVGKALLVEMNQALNVAREQNDETKYVKKLGLTV